MTDPELLHEWAERVVEAEEDLVLDENLVTAAVQNQLVAEHLEELALSGQLDDQTREAAEQLYASLARLTATWEKYR